MRIAAAIPVVKHDAGGNDTFPLKSLDHTTTRSTGDRMPYATLSISELKNFAPLNLKRPVELAKKIATHIGANPRDITCESALNGKAVKITHKSKQPNVLKDEIRGPSVADVQAQAAQAETLRFLIEDITNLRTDRVQPASKALEKGCGTLDGIIQAVKELKKKSNSQDFRDVADAAGKWDGTLRGVGYQTVGKDVKTHLEFLKNKADSELRKIKVKLKSVPGAKKDFETLENELAVARAHKQEFGNKYTEMVKLVTSTKQQINQKYQAQGHGAILA